MDKSVPQLKLWQNESGRWSVAYVDKFRTDIDNFMIPCKAMNMQPAAFIQYVLEKYPNTFVFGRADGTFFSFYWEEDNEATARKYKNDMNKIIRQSGLKI